MNRPMLKVAAAALLVAGGQVGLAYAQPGDSGTSSQDKEKERLEQQTKLYEAEKAMWQAREAASKAETASTQATFGPLGTFDNSKGGSISFGAKDQGPGTLEGSLLAATATREAGDRFARRLCEMFAPAGRRSQSRCESRNSAQFEEEPPTLPYDVSGVDPCGSLFVPDSLPALPVGPRGERPFIFLSEGQNSNFEIYETLMVRLTSAGRQMCNALSVAEEQNARSLELLATVGKTGRQSGPTPVSGLPITAAATALTTLANLFRTDYSVAYHDLPEDNLLLIKETVSGFLSRRPGSWVHAPELFPLAPSEGSNPLEAKLRVMDAVLGKVVAESGEQARLQTLLTAALPGLKGEPLAAVTAARDMHKSHRENLVAAAKVYTDYLTSTAQGADGKQPPLALGLRQARAAQMLKGGGVLVLMKMNLMGATSFTKKNFWTSFGGMPFYASGGVIASYAVMEGRSGRLLDAASVPIASGFKSVPEVHRSFRSRQARILGRD